MSELPMADTESESGSDSSSDLADEALEAGGVADAADNLSSAAANFRPSARRSNLPLLDGPTAAAASAPAVDRPRCDVVIHETHNTDIGARVLTIALLDLDREIARAAESRPQAHYPRPVPRLFADNTWRFLQWVRVMRQRLAARDPDGDC